MKIKLIKPISLTIPEIRIGYEFIVTKEKSSGVYCRLYRDDMGIDIVPTRDYFLFNSEYQEI